jgi:hypothetical protein
MRFTPPPLPILPPSTLSPQQHLLRSTEYEAPYYVIKRKSELLKVFFYYILLLLLSLALQPSIGIGLLLKMWLNFLEASQQFSFLQGRVVSPTPNPHPGGPGLCIYIPQRQGGYPF